jgi:pectin methylesterase-like acyl-CoA thioesterase
MKTLFSLISISILVFVNSGSSQLAGHYQIGSGGDFLTFSAAVDSLISQGVSDSVIFDVKTGYYREQLMIPEISGADSNNTITFKSQVGVADSVVLWDSTTSAENYVVKLDSADFIIFKDMTFEAHGITYARIFHLEHDARNVQIRNNILNTYHTSGSSEDQTAIFSAGGLTYTTQNLIIEGNQFNGSSYGISLSGRGYSIYFDPGTRIINNNFITTSRCIYITSHQAPIVEGNTIHASGDGIVLGGCKGALKVLRNRVYFTQYRGIEISSCEGTASERGLIANNFIRETGGYGYLRGIILRLQCSYQNVLYNTIIFENVGSYGVFRAASAGYTSSNNRILNNNFVCLDRVYAYTADPPSMISESDYNNIYNGSNILAYWGNTACPNLDSLQQASGMDGHSISVWPMFPDLNQPYTKHPWLNGSAIPVPEVTDDIDGNPRDPNHPDIGCCEFDANPNPTTYSGVLTIGAGGDFGSFSEAYDSLAWRGIEGPVTLEAMPGDYTGQLKIRSIPGASWQDTVVFTSQTGNPEDVSLHYPQSGGEGNYILYFYGSDHLSFENLTLFSDTSGTTNNYRIVNFYGETENIQLKHNHFYGPPYQNVSGSSLIQMGDLSSFHQRRIISGNYFEGGGQTAITSEDDQSKLHIVNNTFKLMRGAIYIDSSYPPIIIDNVMKQIFLNNLWHSAIWLNGINGSFEVTRNKISASGRYAMYVQGCQSSSGQESLIANNFIIAGGGTGTKYGMWIRSTSNLKIFANNISIVGSSTLTNGRSINVQNSTQLQFINNILSNNCDGYTYYVDNPTAIISSDFNDIFSSGPILTYWGGTEVPDLDSLRILSGMDISSISEDPGYYEPTSNLHVTSPALDSAATPLQEITVDIDGDLRDLNYPDIGADEFVPGNYPPYVVNPLPDTSYREDSGMHLISEDLNTVFLDPNPLDSLHFTFISTNPSIHHHLISDSFFVSSDSNFFGMGDMVVIAHDTLGLMCRDTFQITITNVNDPPRISGLPDTVTFEADTSVTLDIWSYVEDPDIADSLLYYLFELEPTSTNLVAEYDSTTGILTCSSSSVNNSYFASIHMSVTGDSGLVAKDSIIVEVIAVTGIENEWQNQIPQKFVLTQNYPNPFNPVTTIRYGLPTMAQVKIEVFNVLGQRLITLIDDQQTAGYHEVRLEASSLGSGVYFYRFTAEKYCQTKKLIIMK